MRNNITGMNNSVLEDSYKWRRQKNYETEISTLNDKLRKMQEKLEGLQQKQLQGDLFRGRTSLLD